MKEFFYDVKGTEYHDTEAFGEAWKKAKAQATAEHCGIRRTVVHGEHISYEFYAKGGLFLSDRFYTPDSLYIF